MRTVAQRGLRGRIDEERDAKGERQRRVQADHWLPLNWEEEARA